MNITEWNKKINKWGAFKNCQLFPPASPQSVEAAIKSVGDIPDCLKYFWLSTNGIIINSLKILPVENFKNKKTIKQTWDSIQRANDEKKTRFLSSSLILLKDFIVFSDIGVGYAGLISRRNKSIWFEDIDCIRETSSCLEDFISSFLNEQHPM